MATINIKTLDGLLEIFGGYQSIIDALGYIPANKDGVLSDDYFSDLDGDDFVISDKNGNVIFKVDKNGIASTKITVNDASITNLSANEAIIDKSSVGLLEASAGIIDNLQATTLTVETVEGDIKANGIQADNITSSLVSADIIEAAEIKSSGDSYTIADKDGNIIAKIDNNGIETTYIKANNITGDLEGTIHGNLVGNVTGNVIGNLTGDVTGNVIGNLTGDVVDASTVITGNIIDSGSDFTIIDNNGNRVLAVDINGLETTKIKASTIEGNLVGNVTGNVIGNLTGDVTGDIANITTITSNKIVTNDLDVNNLSSTKTLNVSNHANIPVLNSAEISSNNVNADTVTTDTIIDSGSDFTIIDNNGNRVLSVDINGLETTNIKAFKVDADEININDKVVAPELEVVNLKAITATVSDTTTTDKLVVNTSASIPTITSNLNVEGTLSVPTIDTTTVNADTVTTDTIIDSGSDFTIIDNSGNRIFAVDANGLETTNVKAFKVDADEINISDKIAAPNLEVVNLKATEVTVTDTTTTDKLTVSTSASIPTITSNLNVEGTLSVPTIDTTTVTATSLSGNLTGNVTGNVKGNVEGNLTGNVTGDLTGNVTGNLTGETVNTTNLTAITATVSDTTTTDKLVVSTSASIPTITSNLNVNGTLSAPTIDTDNVNADIVTTDTIIDSGSDFTIIDNSGNRIFAVNANGLETTNVKAFKVDADEINISDKIVAPNLEVTSLKAEIATISDTTTTDKLTVNTSASIPTITSNLNVDGSLSAPSIDATTITATNLSGNLTGNVKGNLTGDVTGNLTGNVTGNLKGNVEGNLTGETVNITNLTTVTATVSDTTTTDKLVVNTSASIPTITSNLKVEGTLSAPVVDANDVNADTVTTNNLKNTGDSYSFTDKDGNILATFDANGLETTNVKAFKVDADEINISDKIVSPELEVVNLKATTATISDTTTTDKLTVNTSASIPTITSNLNVNGTLSAPTIDSTTITATSLSGNLTGNVTGNVKGNVEGNLTGNVTGDLTGNVTGNLTGETVNTTNLTAITATVSDTTTTDKLVVGTSASIPTITSNLNVNGTLSAPTIDSNNVNADTVTTNNLKNTGDSYSFTDKDGNILATFDANGLETTNVKAFKVDADEINSDKITAPELEVVNLKAATATVSDTTTTDKLTVNTSASIPTITSNLTVNGTLSTPTIDATTITATNLSGNLTGNVTGNVKGNVEGNLTGNVTGDITGNVTGNLTGETVNTTNLTAITATVSDTTTTDKLVVGTSASIPTITSNLNVNGTLSAPIIDATDVNADTVTTNNLKNTGDSYSFTDKNGNILATFDKNGLSTTKVTANEFYGNLKGKSDDATHADYADEAGNSSSADKVNSKLTIIYGPTSGTGVSEEFDGSSNKSVTITPATLGLAQAMLYIGTSTTEITDAGNQQPTIGGSKKTPVAGNVVIYDNNEFIYNGSAWEKLGDEMNHKVLQTPVSDPTANGKATAFIDSIIQDKNGNIVVTKKNVDTNNIEASNINVATINVTNLNVSDTTTTDKLVVSTSASLNKIITDLEVEGTLSSPYISGDVIETNNLKNTGDSYSFADKNGNILATFDKNGLSTTKVTVNEFYGDLTGNVTGNVKGNVEGNVTGNLEGTARDANKLNTDAGATNKPVYFKNGIPVEAAFTVDKSVPANAVFTDTNTTYTFTGGQTNSFKVKPSTNGTAGTEQTVDININIPNNVIYETSTKDRVPVFSNTTGTITSSDVIISGDDIVADKITVNTIDNSSGEITTSKVITDNIQQSGAIYNITDSEGNIIATFDANGLSTTNVSALNKVIANSFEGNISWNNVTGRPSIVTPDGTTNSTGAHTHTATFSDTAGHTHSVSTVADSSNKATVSTAAHTHTGTAANAKVSGSVTLTGSRSDAGVLTINATFSDTAGHTHSVSTVADSSNKATVSTAAHTHTGTAANAKVSGSVTTQSSGSHSHTVNTQNIEY